MSNHVQPGNAGPAPRTSSRPAPAASPIAGGAQNRQGSDNNLIPFPGRTRTEIKNLRRALAGEDSPKPVPTPATETPRRARTTRRPSPLGVLVPGLRLPKELSGYRPQDAGILTHAILAIVTPSLRDIDPGDLAEYLFDVSGSLVNGSNINRRRVLQMTASAHAHRYLRRYAPAPPWGLIGAEFQTGNGRTDLAWRNPETGRVFFDEIKTHNRPIGAIQPEVVAQADRQALGGLAQFGDDFAGVRVVPFGALHLVTLYHPQQKPRRLIPTPARPLTETLAHDWDAYSASCR